MLLRTALILALPLLALPAVAERLEIWMDADFSIQSRSAEMIELGVAAALSEVDNRIAGLPVDIVRRDHRGNAKRSFATLRLFSESTHGLSVIGGIHSPSYITYRDEINAARVPLLLPWSAGGPITRAATDDNWIFRLSVDDWKAAPFLVDQALADGCTSVALVMLNSGWGRANLAGMKDALSLHGHVPAVDVLLDLVASPAHIGSVVNTVVQSGADCVLLTSVTESGAALVNSFAAQPKAIRIYSHWGILGGGFAELAPAAARDAVSLRVLQTCGLRIEAAGSASLRAALQSAEVGGVVISRLQNLTAPTGFVHAYDLTRILISAGEQAAETTAWSGSIEDRRAALRAALQRLERPVEGILGTYAPPFEPYQMGRIDAHEALGVDDLCLAAFDRTGHLVDAPRGVR